GRRPRCAGPAPPISSPTRDPRPPMARSGEQAMKVSTVACMVVIALCAGGPAVAHHSPVMFDRSKRVALTGTVTEFAWTNPHASIQLNVPNDSGGVDRWGV